MSGTELLKGRRILVVEDETMIAMMVEDMLADLGCVVVGPAHGLDEALAIAKGEQGIDAALLDINLAGQPVFALADALRTRGVPMVFSTGYGEGGLRDIDAAAPVLQKPYLTADLARALVETIGDR